MKIEEWTEFRGTAYLNIEPESHLQVNRSHFGAKGIYKVIVGIDQEQIGQGCKSPLQTGIDSKIIPLITVLN